MCNSLCLRKYFSANEVELQLPNAIYVENEDKQVGQCTNNKQNE